MFYLLFCYYSLMKVEYLIFYLIDSCVYNAIDLTAM